MSEQKGGEVWWIEGGVARSYVDTDGTDHVDCGESLFTYLISSVAFWRDVYLLARMLEK